ncbi:type II secretion system F family protein [Micromonospora sp. NPDC049275]|uniref:type II secretion system F family protein n=1 Tax=Micromonospora sp. NPDC049275 TaxID=3364268 RepID=UPI003710FC93
MTGGTVLVVGLLLAAAVLVAWPARTVRARRRRVLAPGRGATGADPDDALVEWIRGLARGPGGPTDEFGDLPAPARPGGPSYTPGASPSSGGRTAVAWSTRDLDGSPSRPRATGGPGGSTRPAGPARPPIRRDPRRPAATARPETEALETVEHPGHASVDQAHHRLVHPADDGRLGLAERRLVDPADDGRVGPADHRLVGPADRTAGGSYAAHPARVRRSPGRVLLLVGLVGAGVGAVSAGPVAAVAVAGYGTLAMRALLRWRANRHAEMARRRGLDLLCGLAADLRAGLPVPPTLEIAAAEGPAGADRLRELTSAAVRLADRTGAPLAELIERIEADARATDRGLAAAAAQAAGARATAWLLAALPVGGIGLGYGIGVDPLAVLLHSMVGGVCAVLAVALQVVGLLWAERLGAASGRAA